MRARRWVLVIFGVAAFPLAAQQPGAAPPAQNSGNSSQLLELLSQAAGGHLPLPLQSRCSIVAFRHLPVLAQFELLDPILAGRR